MWAENCSKVEYDTDAFTSVKHGDTMGGETKYVFGRGERSTAQSILPHSVQTRLLPNIVPCPTHLENY